jgi:hypothetical protein
LKTKIGKSKKFFIPYHTRTYGENGVYNFVDFRIKRAGTSNYGGLMIFDLRYLGHKLTIDDLEAKPADVCLIT